MRKVYAKMVPKVLTSEMKELRYSAEWDTASIVSGLLNIFSTDEAHFALNGAVNTQNTRIWAMSNPREYVTKSLYQAKLTLWCGFTSFFIVGPFLFEEPCPTLRYKMSIETAGCHFTLLLDKVMPALNQRSAFYL
ncbi:DUF4817 domain-containing protein [Trichonephila clavipes]|nr:DUF4817 domain-containing protein [Trichonephila clavipes]